LRQGAAAEKTMSDDTLQTGQGEPVELSEKDTNAKVQRRQNNRRRAEASFNMDELRELISLIRENGLAEFELEHKGFRVRLRREESQRFVDVESGDAAVALEEMPAPPAGRNPSPSGRAATASPVHPGASAETAASEDQDLHIINSPIVGTFYRAPSPNAESFVKIGSMVDAESVVCIIEAMKLMNEIQAETAGEVVKIYVENGQPVEYGQPLFGIKR
jgi:acetyl-CoA carboxylase biotin carboxyl carrier protein